ncbi:unnamed protein product [Thlaspi arvense]|uniref:Pentatricopeptide repeat-containing protein n=1 Tax=Thlaspi arvense TaxID=13288 RepID=A0AAU9T7L2_THLAR|nr:unnamed protein product [Thlaspi arvense]
MVSQGFLPSRFTLASVLSACSKLLDGVTGMRCHGTAVKTGLDKNIFVGNALLSMYAKCGLMVDHGVRVFESLSGPNEVSFTAVINGLAREDKVLEAVHMFRSMREKGVKVDSVCLSNILSISAPREECDSSNETYCNVMGKQIHSLALRLGLEGDLHLNNSLLEVYAKSKDMNGAELVFGEMPEVNVVSWNIMIAGFGQEYRSDKSVEYLKRMRESGFEPNEVTCISVIGACFRSGDFETGQGIFSCMPHRSVVAWNALLSGYSKYEHYEEAINHFRQMQFENLKPDRTTLSVILSSCAKLRLLEGGKQVHGVAIRTNMSKNSHVVSGLIAVYSECEKMEISECIFDDCIAELDIACWNSMIAGSCSRLCSLLHGRQFHGQVVKSGYVSDSFVETALTDMYCKCGEIDSAREIFDTVLIKNTVLWNEMIHGVRKTPGRSWITESNNWTRDCRK